MKTIFITITGGYGIRNIIRTDAFKILKSNKNLRIVVFAPFQAKKIIPEREGKNVFFEDLGKYRPNIVERTLKKMAEMVYFNINYAGTIKIKERMLKHRNRFKYFSLRLVKKILGKDRNLIKALEDFDAILSKYKCQRYKCSFEKYKPSLVFTTDFLHPNEWGLVKTARQCQVPIISMIANWDHFTKGRMPKADKAIVWNEFNKRQLIEYDGYNPSDILVAGIPHQDYFAHLKDKFLPKKKLLKSLGIIGDKKLITYTTAAVSGSRYEQDILQIICEAIKNGKIKKPSHLHVRVHPVDDFSRYEKLKEYKDITTFETAGKSYIDQRFLPSKTPMFASRARPKIWCPDEKDMLHYANLVSRSDVLINVASSVTLDAAALDKPVVNIAFDGYAKKKFIESNARWFMFTHYEYIPKSGGARIAKSADDLINSINMYMDNPKLDCGGRKRIVKEHGGKLDGQCGERIAKFILNFLESVGEKNKKS